MPASAKKPQRTIQSFFKQPKKNTVDGAPVNSNETGIQSTDAQSSPSSGFLHTPVTSSRAPHPSTTLPSSPLTARRSRVPTIDSDDEAMEDDLMIGTKRAPESTQAPVSPLTSASHSPSIEPNEKLTKFSASSEYVPEGRKRALDGVPAAAPAKKSKSDSTAEERYDWLVNIRDADKNPPSHPDYDPRTIFVPPKAWAKFTAFEKQYWEIKAKLWDTVVFFKKGKFYELYENDAEIAHTQFDLKLAGGGRANMQLAGIPEMSFDYWASAFIAKGYKVARVDQKENALSKEMRDQTAGKKDEKIIKRELSCILTAGTLTDETMLVDDLSQYCMAIKRDGLKFAVAFVDTATGAFLLTDFKDDGDFRHFETLLAQTRPREIILERGNMDKILTRIIKTNTSPDTLWNIIKPNDEFWDEDTTLHRLASATYFDAEDLDDFSNYPKVLSDARERPLLMSAFGGLLWYLTELKLDRQLVSLGNFSDYQAVQLGRAMILDGQTLQNIEVFANTFDQSTEGTLFKVLNKCVTPFGKRQLRVWIAHPLLDFQKLEARHDAVGALMQHDAVRDHLESSLADLPDIERLVSRVYGGTLRPRDFARTVEGLAKMTKLLGWLEDQDLSDPLIKSIVSFTEPRFSDLIEPWDMAFDHSTARNDDKLVPEAGVDQQFDDTKAAVSKIEKELEEQMKGYRKQFNSLALCYRDSGKEIYLIEVPIKVKGIPDNWQQMASTSKVKRYWSPEVRILVRELQEARELHKRAADTVQTNMYLKFNQHYKHWIDITKRIALLDCLLSLARTSLNMQVGCRPKFLQQEKSCVKFKELRHPCSDSSFIPNDVFLGDDVPNLSLLTGANAAGKSTVLRMTACAVIMAHIGCYVPAEAAELTPMDRIMTRLGANDNIFAGQSTFHVELSEAEKILSGATSKTLVVIDELGRGGSSSDGFAIAEAVLYHLASYIGCTGFFATHYGTLVQCFDKHPQVRPQRMAIIVDQGHRNVSFLYKLEDGQSEGSFGMNVALMCGVSIEIVEKAEAAAKEYEQTQRLAKVGFQGIPLGLQSDVVYSQNNEPPSRAVEVMVAISQEF